LRDLPHGEVLGEDCEKNRSSSWRS